MAQSEKRENSVLFSLRELRQIEDTRVQEEANAQRSAEEARVRAIHEREQQAREAEEARVRAIYEAEQRQREAAEAQVREERMRLQEAETQARIRAQAELEQQRLHHEMQIKMQEVAKTRPTWLLATAGVLTVAIISLGIFFYKRHQEASAAEERNRVLAIQQAEQEREFKELTDSFNKLQAEIALIDGEMVAANKALNDAQSAAEVKAARDRLAAIERRQADAKARQQAIQRDIAKRERERKVNLSDDCKNSALGCS